MKTLKNFIILWLGQSISSLGSSMTGFAITIWIYQETGSALALSVSGLSLLLPKIVGGILAGPIVDRLNKKYVMIFADIGAGLCTLILFCLLQTDSLHTWQIYCINLANGLFSSFQSPASDVAVSLIVPKEYYIKTSGMQSFSSGTVNVLSAVFAAAVLGFVGIEGVIAFDLLSMAVACLTLALFVKIPSAEQSGGGPLHARQYWGELKQGFSAVKESGLLKRLLLFFAFINFVSGITYFNLISPMILARSGNDPAILAIVNGAIGLGSIAGGALIVFFPSAKNKIRAIFFCTALSFFLGDMLLAVGRVAPVWAVAGFLSSFFIPAIIANQDYFWRTVIPAGLQGRAFSFKRAVGTGMVSLGMFFGGTLADYVLEPFMAGNTGILSGLLGSGAGTGMALMFLITGTVGTGISIRGFFSRFLQKAEREVEERAQSG